MTILCFLFCIWPFDFFLYIVWNLVIPVELVFIVIQIKVLIQRFFTCCHCRSYMALHKPGRVDLHRMLWNPSGIGGPLLQNTVSDTGCLGHVWTLGKFLWQLGPCSVEIAKIQVVTILNVLQLANSIGNAGFNEIMEANLSAEEIPKPNPSSDMWATDPFHWQLCFFFCEFFHSFYMLYSNINVCLFRY